MITECTQPEALIPLLILHRAAEVYPNDSIASVRDFLLKNGFRERKLDPSIIDARVRDANFWKRNLRPGEFERMLREYNYFYS